MKTSIFDDMAKVPAIGLDPRFAGLVRLAALGFRGKRLETRGYATSHRGPLVIAATTGKSTARDPDLGRCFERARRELVPAHIPAATFDAEIARPGLALALVTVVGVWPLTIGDWPEAFFEPNPERPRFAWELADMRPLAPFPVRPAQAFFAVPTEFVLGGLVNALAEARFAGDRRRALDDLHSDGAGLGAERWRRLGF